MNKRQKQIEDIFLQKEVNLAVKKAREREEKRKKIQGFLDKPLFKTRPQETTKDKKKSRGKKPKVDVQRGIKSLWDII